MTNKHINTRHFNDVFIDRSQMRRFMIPHPTKRWYGTLSLLLLHCLTLFNLQLLAVLDLKIVYVNLCLCWLLLIKCLHYLFFYQLFVHQHLISFLFLLINQREDGIASGSSNSGSTPTEGVGSATSVLPNFDTTSFPCFVKVNLELLI